jgi:hypothetical protein
LEALSGNLKPLHPPVALAKKDACPVAIAIKRQKMLAIIDRAEQLRGTHPDRDSQQPCLWMFPVFSNQPIDHSIGGLPMRISH